jgi:ABC-type branched-subunit amino acid transport system ATPase component
MLAISRGLLLLDEPSLGLASAMINKLHAILADLRDDGATGRVARLALAEAVQ